MSVINDSTAEYEPDRQFSQLQALLAVVRDRTGQPAKEIFRWLDLGCGQGQVLSQLGDATTSIARSKIEFYGLDAKADYVNNAQKVAEVQSLKAFHGYVGAIEDFSAILNAGIGFDLISCVNVFHELRPEFLPPLLVTSLTSLAPDGLFFAYDMESLEPAKLELGAINWSFLEMREVLSILGNAIDSPNAIGIYPWRHSKVDAWHFEVDRRHLSAIGEKLQRDGREIQDILLRGIRELIARKLEVCRLKLESLTVGGVVTQAESDSKLRALYDYWAFSRTCERLSR